MKQSKNCELVFCPDCGKQTDPVHETKAVIRIHGQLVCTCCGWSA